MLFSIAGSQGSGKTSIINALRDRGYSIVSRKTSRSVINEWKLSLDEIHKDSILATKFQDELLKRKFIDDQQLNDNIVFTERTFTDLFVYTLISLGSQNDKSKWLDRYYNHCKQNNIIYDRIFYLPTGVFNIEYDGVRSTNPHFSRMVDLTLQHFYKEMLDDSSKFVVLKSSTVDDRINEILNHVSGEKI